MVYFTLILPKAKLRWRNFWDYTQLYRTAKHSISQLSLRTDALKTGKHMENMRGTWEKHGQNSTLVIDTSKYELFTPDTSFSDWQSDKSCGECWVEIMRHTWRKNIGSQENSHSWEETISGKKHLTNSTLSVKTRWRQNRFQLVTLLMSQLSLLIEKQSI